ncbi:MAG TPA: hypothetical protein VN648_15590, partial [Candidatus Methylomirabilis sp.]|nr:hypothetical protein [Candidatus Methylomirabilis sp.]
MTAGPPPRLLFCSYHSYFDPSSGAALATRDLLELLVARGWDCRVFCGPLLDFEATTSVEQLLTNHGLPYDRRDCTSGSLLFSVFHFTQAGVP